MPIYTFECECNEEFELLTSMKEYENNFKNTELICPECGGKSIKSTVSVGGFNFTNPVGTDRYSNSHGYRYNHNHERPGGIRDQREFNEKNSHMGSSGGYTPIDDISSGENFGEVK